MSHLAEDKCDISSLTVGLTVGRDFYEALNTPKVCHKPKEQEYMGGHVSARHLAVPA